MEDNPSLTETAFGVPIDELTRDRRFTRANTRIKACRGLIDDQISRIEAGDPNREVSEFLNFMLNEALFSDESPRTFKQKMETVAALLREEYAEEWKGAAMDHFDFWCDRVRDWNSFFLSYTNKSPRELNNDYEDVINYFLSSSSDLEERWDTANLLAEVLIELLRKHNIKKGFFDKKDLKHGDPFVREIESACENTFTFVQLLHRDTFFSRTENWCFTEYSIFVEKNRELINKHGQYAMVLDTRYRPAVAAKDANGALPKLFPPRYAEWKKDAFGVHFKLLPRQPESFRETVDQIAGAIVGVQKEILGCVPVQ